MGVRVLSRFFDPVGHETMYASSGNKHFFSLNPAIIRPTKIMNNILEHLKICKFKVVLLKLVKYFQRKFSAKNI